MSAPEPRNETDRIVALASYDLLDTAAEDGFDAIAQLAARLCGTPISVVSLIGQMRQWTKASVGFPQGSELPRKDAFCSRTILQADMLEVRDLTLDERFAQNPLVTGDLSLRFYAGVPLVDSDGFALGTLCVIDRKPRELDPEQRQNLVLLARATMELIASRATMPRSQRARVEALAAAVESAGDPIFIHETPTADNVPKITYVNPAFTRVFGYSSDEIVGKRFRSLYGPHTDREATEIFRARVAANEAVDASLALYDRDGAMHEIDLHSRPIVGDAGDTAFWVATLRDVTAERRSARDLARGAERTRALYAIASSHASASLEQIDAALEVGLRDLDLTCGFAATIDAGTLSLTNCVGTEPIGSVGERVTLAGSTYEPAAGLLDVVTYDDASETHFARFSSSPASAYRALVLAPVVVGGESAGLIGFASRTKRREPFTESDRDFVRLVAALIGSARERSAQQRRLDTLAFYDALTGLPNRSLFAERLERALAASARSGAPFALHYVDLDGFKTVNDTGGHDLGDEVLREAASRLNESIRDGDTAARLGGDEFVVLQLDVTSREDIARFAERIVRRMRDPLQAPNERCALRASVGVARYPTDGTSADVLLARADAAQYAAKRAGKDRVAFAEDLETFSRI